METKQKGIAETIKDEIVSAIKGTGEVVSAAVSTVSDVVTNTIRNVGKIGTSTMEATSDVVKAQGSRR